MALSATERRRLLHRAVRERLALAGDYADELRPAYNRLRATVASRAAAGAATVAGLIRLADMAGAGGIIRDAWRDSLAGGVDLAATATETAITINPADPWWHVMEQAADKRIKHIDAVTMERVKGYVEVGVQEGWSPGKLAAHIRDDPSHAFDQTRALVVARTETAYAYNLGSIEGYRLSERVARVLVFDGEECTWPEGHGDEPYADGMVVTLDEAEEYPIAHPNCVRAFTPVVE